MIDLIVTPVLAERIANTRRGLIDVLADHVHRMACEAANLHKLQHPKSQEFMEQETGRKGWRAYLSEATARAVDVMEASGVYRFVHVDELPDA